MDKKTRVVIVDDYVPYREFLAEILRATSDIEVLGTGGSADDAVQLASQLAPDVLLLDLDMPGGGIEAARRLAATCPAVQVVVLTVSDSAVHRHAAAEAGVKKYLLKGLSGGEIASTLRWYG